MGVVYTKPSWTHHGVDVVLFALLVFPIVMKYGSMCMKLQMSHTGPLLCIETRAFITHGRQFHVQRGGPPSDAAVLERRRVMEVIRAQTEKTNHLRRTERKLYLSAQNGLVEETLECLSHNDIHPDAGGEDGWTPAMRASELGHSVVLGTLIAAKCNVNKRNIYGQTPLSFAAQENHIDCVMQLLEAGAEVEPEGQALTAAEVARKAGHQETADMLAAQAAEKQRSQFLEALTDGVASGSFDSKRDRLQALCQAVGLKIDLEEEEGSDLEDNGDTQCVVCLDETVDTALSPCFHAQFCTPCAVEAAARGSCPVCRGDVKGIQRIYLP
eukprot:m.279554 g.279554  ORF g.279554 m.279554 type:complete len:327 (-) comp16323_c11_seq17:1142-2122(-)